MVKLRVFLADDHAALREGLQLLINAQRDMEVVGQAGDGRAAVRLAQACRPDIVVMDISMPDITGAEATERIMATCPGARVLALTRHSDLGHLRRLLEAGAAGYVLKRTAADALIGAIRAIAAGGHYLDPSLAGRVIGGFVARSPSKNFGARLTELTERETEILKLIAWGQSIKEIAAQLAISVKTVEYHKARSMEKLYLRSRTDIVRYAVLQGWLQEDNAPE